jgi:hypothetical protein
MQSFAKRLNSTYDNPLAMQINRSVGGEALYAYRFNCNPVATFSDEKQGILLEKHACEIQIFGISAGNVRQTVRKFDLIVRDNFNATITVDEIDGTEIWPSICLPVRFIPRSKTYTIVGQPKLVRAVFTMNGVEDSLGWSVALACTSMEIVFKINAENHETLDMNMFMKGMGYNWNTMFPSYINVKPKIEAFLKEHGHSLRPHSATREDNKGPTSVTSAINSSTPESSSSATIPSTSVSTIPPASLAASASASALPVARAVKKNSSVAS